MLVGHEFVPFYVMVPVRHYITPTSSLCEIGNMKARPHFIISAWARPAFIMQGTQAAARTELAANHLSTNTRNS